MRELLLNRVSLVQELNSNPKVHYSDKMLILTAVLTACAALRWPRAPDKKRFVELLVMHSPSDLHCDRVSTAALVQSGLIDEKETPWGVPGYATRNFLGDDEFQGRTIDVPLKESIVRYPKISEGDLKKNSYAALIYERLRCAYAHEYVIGSNNIEVPASEFGTKVSYIGRFLSSEDDDIRRMTHFHLEYLIELARFHAGSVSGGRKPKPAAWWLPSAEKKQCECPITP